MINFGCGNAICGNSVCGFGSPNTALSVDFIFLPNPATQQIMDSPLLSVVANVGGQPVLDLTYSPGMVLQGMNSVDAQVILAISTVAGTAVDVNVGSQLFNVLIFNPDNYQTLIQEEVETALNLLIQSGSITLVGVDATIDPTVSTRGNVQITYTNNTTNIQTKLSI